jgi:dipeptidase
MYAPDVITFAREKGYFNGEDKDFSFCDAYAPLDFSGMRACEARAWSAFNILCDGKFTYMDENGNEVTADAYDYIDYAMGWDQSKRFPLFVKPSRKITVKDVADVMRDHYEGTPMDMTTDIGAGGNALPYRWRPMGFKHEDKSYINERAIATQQTGFWFVGQVRGHLPDIIGGVNWFGCDDAATSYLTPIYVSTYDVPESFRVGNGNMITYSPTSAFWMTNRVANACYKAYNIMFPTVDAEIDAWEKAMMEAVAKADQEALELYNSALKQPKKNLKRNDKVRKCADNFATVRKYLTEFSLSNAQTIFDKWVALEQLLLIKYIDGNVKAQNEDGSFITNEHTDCIPAKITQPGYTDKWKECVAKDNGKILESR